MKPEVLDALPRICSSGRYVPAVHGAVWWPKAGVLNRIEQSRDLLGLASVIQ